MPTTPRRAAAAAAARSLLLLLLLLAAAACSTLRSKPYRYSVDFDSEGPRWQEASHTQTRGVMTREYVRPGETLASWRELLTVQVFEKARRGGGFPAPPAAEAALRATMSARCPDVAWNELAADSAGVLYEWRVSGCARQPDQHEIARIVEGAGARARIAYARKGGAMPDSVRASWAERLRRARFTTAPIR